MSLLLLLLDFGVIRWSVMMCLSDRFLHWILLMLMLLWIEFVVVLPLVETVPTTPVASDLGGASPRARSRVRTAAEEAASRASGAV